MGEQTARFLNCVNALANNIRLIGELEPKVAADLVLVQAAPVVPEPAPERLAMHQRLPNERPRSYDDSGDPRVIFAESTTPDTVKVEPVAGGTHITTTQRRAE
jgi:hypothetical protein